MTKDYYSFKQLPFSKLFNTYVDEFSKLNDFYSVNPFSDDEVEKKADRIIQPKNKSRYIEALQKFHNFLGITETQQLQLQKFKSEDALVIVTGQQLGIYGGPLFTIYKTITTIILARHWESKLNRPVIPVFWLADEDHDFEEISSIGIPDYSEFKKIVLEEEGDGHPVSNQNIKDTIKGFESVVREELPDTDFTDQLFLSLNDFYKEGFTHVQAFAQLMNSWFADEGLLIVGSNFEPIKELGSEVLITSISEAGAISEALESKSQAIEVAYNRQVIVGDSNLFYLDQNEGRVKIERSKNDWVLGEITLSEDKLLSMIKANPQKFSPNVFLRPVLQDALLPTLGYVAGPGELAYYGQMKDLYPIFGMEMPVIFPRLSITLIESGIERIMEKLPFEMCSYNQRIEDLEAAYVEQTNSKDIEGIFGEWKQLIEEIAEKPSTFIKDIDPTLEGTTGKVVTGFSNELDKLKGKVYRSIKQQEQTQLNRIAKIKSQLFPDGLQERSVSPVYFMNKYGLDIWKNLLTDFEQGELNLRIHHIITI